MNDPHIDGSDCFGKMLKLLDKWFTPRKRLLSSKRIPQFAKWKGIVHVVPPIFFVLAMACVYTNTHMLSIFSFHPLFMLLACVVCMSEGVVAYRNRFFLEIFAPIMSHGDRTKNRTIHSTLQMMAGFFVSLGLLLIVGNKIKKHSTVFPCTLHAWLGFVVIFLMATQIVVGCRKYNSMTTGVIDSRSKNQLARYRWHGKVGLLTFDLAMATTLLGLLQYLPFAYTVGLFPLLLLLWVNVGVQGLDSGPGTNAASQASPTGEHLLTKRTSDLIITGDRERGAEEGEALEASYGLGLVSTNRGLSLGMSAGRGGGGGGGGLQHVSNSNNVDDLMEENAQSV